MEIQIIFLLIGIAFVVLVYVFKPLISRNFIVNTNNNAYSQLVAERERIINILMELDFDYSLGKILEGDYASQRAELISKGGTIMEQIDVITKSKKQTVERIDDASTLSDKDIEQMLDKRRGQKSEIGTYLCPECGKPILQSDHFCPSCGKKINTKRNK